MRIDSHLSGALVLVTILAAGSVSPGRAQLEAEPGAGYGWADACRTCHAEIHAAWAQTKHARALGRLTSAEQERECVTCHVTGATFRLRQEGTIVNAGVQCEACHGAAQAHAADPTVRTGLVRKTPAATCQTCHNERSPHFRGFFYDAMRGSVHRVKK